MRLTKEIVAKGATNGTHTYDQLRAIGVRFEKNQPTRWKWMIDIAEITQEQHDKFIALKKPEAPRKTKRFHKKVKAPSGPFAGMQKEYYFKSDLWKSIKCAVLSKQSFCTYCNAKACEVRVQNWVADVWSGRDLEAFHALCTIHFNMAAQRKEAPICSA